MKLTSQVTLLALVISVLSGCASPAPDLPPEPAPDTSQVEGLEQQMLEDFENRRFDDMLGRMTSDIQILGPDGVLDRAVWRARIGQQECEYDDGITLSDTTVSVLAPTVVSISYRTDAVGTCDGSAVEPQLSTSVWVWEDGEWLTALHHSNPLPMESADE